MKSGERIKQKSEEFFDEMALRREIIPEPDLCYEHILPYFKELSGGRVADIGCGMGKMLAMIEQQYPGKFHLSGIDLSTESLRIAREFCGESVNLVRGDVEVLPFGDSSFDILLCMHSFHHYPRPIQALKEMHRVLQRGGVLYLVENDYPALKRMKKNLKYLLMRYPRGDVHMYSSRELLKLIRKAGFDAEEPRHLADYSQLLICRKA